MYDDGTVDGRPVADNGCHEVTVRAPTFDPLAFDVNWKALPAELMYEILGLPHRIERLQQYLSNDDDFYNPPEHVEFFWARQHAYAVLGLEVSDIARRLRQHAALPPLPPNSNGGDRDNLLQNIRDTIDSKRTTYRRRIAELDAESWLHMEDG